ncbi:MAG: hypothetical protein QW318_03455 [Candidatus Caldarchaeum sp.]|uniref:Uncharacterized protein n=1 Tax=Caldiarchaeum subterraneum TaxID=311458 RepID=A0A7J3G5J8_CALS0
MKPFSPPELTRYVIDACREIYQPLPEMLRLKHEDTFEQLLEKITHFLEARGAAEQVADTFTSYILKKAADRLEADGYAQLADELLSILEVDKA